MGQGTLTGLAQLVAEELECDWDKVTTEYPTPGQSLARDRPWGSFATGGSRGIREQPSVRARGRRPGPGDAHQAAAEAWGVPAAECRARDSVITHGPSGRTLTYGAVADAAAELWPPEQVTLKDPADWRVIGTAQARLDTPDKLTASRSTAPT
jgi:isoquinoline 1-oxidoreductase beta subunit